MHVIKGMVGCLGVMEMFVRGDKKHCMSFWLFKAGDGGTQEHWMV